MKYFYEIETARDSLDLKIKYFTDLPPLEYIDGKSDWIDLRAADDVRLEAGESFLVPLGVAIKLPLGYEALVVPRSSSFKNYGFIQTNSMGVIDEAYCGNSDEWKLPILAMREVAIRKGDRIAQFRVIQHQPPLNFIEVSSLGEIDRGGFGSTGTN